MNSEGFYVCLGIIYVEFPKVKYREHDAKQIYEDPDGVENIVTVRTLHSILWECFRMTRIVFLEKENVSLRLLNLFTL